MGLWDILKQLYMQESTRFHDRQNGSLQDQNTEWIKQFLRNPKLQQIPIYNDAQAYSPREHMAIRNPMFMEQMMRRDMDTNRYLRDPRLNTGPDLERDMMDLWQETHTNIRKHKSNL